MTDLFLPDVEDSEVWVQVPARLRICEEDFMDCRDDRNRSGISVDNFMFGAKLAKSVPTCEKNNFKEIFT